MAAPPAPATQDDAIDDGRPDIHLDEDWAATVVGLGLLLLVIAGVLTHGMFLGLAP